MLTIHRAARADALVDALAGVLVDSLDDPFTPEVVAVPTQGIERWLTHRLSSVLGASPTAMTASAPTSSSPSPCAWSAWPSPQPPGWILTPNAGCTRLSAGVGTSGAQLASPARTAGYRAERGS